MTYYHRTRTRAESLDEEGVAELIEEGWDDQLILVDGVPYDVEDLHRCDGCKLYFADPCELDEDEFLEPLCEDCLVEAHEEAEAQRDLETWARWARR